MSDLEALSAELNDKTAALLGATISYTPASGPALTFKAIADWGEERRDFGGSAAIGGDAAVEIPISRAPVRPDKACIVKRVSTAEEFRPKDVKRDAAGENWLILLEKKV